MRYHLSAVLTLIVLAAGCQYPEYMDEADVCFPPSQDRLVVSAKWPCGSDHKGAKISCSVEVEDGIVRVSSKFSDGKDPNDACAEPLVTTCESEPLEPGEYVVVHGDDQFDVSIPNDDQTSCEEPL